MILGTQYYRPPFPESRYWEKDIPWIKETGLNTIMLWVNWAWVESEPGVFDFSDYDAIMDLAHKNGLKVVLSSIAELQPYWIHRIIPGSEMIDNMGHKVISSNRGESNQGLTPGGCFDNPEVEARMEVFLRTLASHYKSHPALIAWDAWNETRWEVGADGLVCYCPHTIKLFKKWLDERYGGLDGLNRAWKRRYSSWADVMPGKAYRRTYSEMVDWSLFFQWRQNKHLSFRYRVLKEADPNHMITVHGPCPTMYHGAWGPNGESATHLTGEMDHTIFHRGNDWDMAEVVDGLGSSHFPISQKNDVMEYGGRVEMIKSAVRDKKVCWVSELQGGKVDGDLQQLWLWTSYARGAKAVIFWNWRPEVFGRESGAVSGIIGLDGNREGRITNLKKASEILTKYGDILDSYNPAHAKAGIFFDTSSWAIEWANSGRADKSFKATIGYVRAMERTQIPYTFVESRHLDVIDELNFLIMPQAIVVSEEAAAKIKAFVQRGGYLLMDGQTDSFVSQGFYRYPDERPFSNGLGIEDLGERYGNNDIIEVDFAGGKYILHLDNELPWTPFKLTENAAALSTNSSGECLMIMTSVGKGKVLACGSLLGYKYYNNAYDNFVEFLKAVALKADAVPEIKVLTKEPLQWRYGKSGDNILIFLINSSGPQKVDIILPDMPKDGVLSLKNGTSYSCTKQQDGYHLTLDMQGISYEILMWK